MYVFLLKWIRYYNSSLQQNDTPAPPFWRHRWKRYKHKKKNGRNKDANETKWSNRQTGSEKAHISGPRLGKREGGWERMGEERETKQEERGGGRRGRERERWWRAREGRRKREKKKRERRGRGTVIGDWSHRAAISLFLWFFTDWRWAGALRMLEG